MHFLNICDQKFGFFAGLWAFVVEGIMDLRGGPDGETPSQPADLSYVTYHKLPRWVIGGIGEESLNGMGSNTWLYADQPIAY